MFPPCITGHGRTQREKDISMLAKPQPGVLSGLKALFSQLAPVRGPKVLMKRDVRKAWGRGMPLSPRVFAGIASEGLGIDTVEIFLSTRGFDVKLNGDRLSEEYLLVPDQNYVGAGFLTCGRGDRSTGRRALGMRFAAAASLGMTRAEICASNKMGAYVWGRAGVRLRDDCVWKLSKAVRQRLALIHGAVDPEVIEKAHKHAEFDSPGDLRAIAELDMPLRGDHAMLFRRALNETASFYSLDEYDGFGFGGQRLETGKFLLAGLSYDADVHFDDSDQMKLIESRTGVRIRAIAALHNPKINPSPVN